MVLVDTSVWVSHLRQGAVGLEALLQEGRVVCHPYIVGELACGNLHNRVEVLVLLQALPQALIAEHEEVLQFIERHGLMGKGLGYIDMHLLSSALLTKIHWEYGRRAIPGWVPRFLQCLERLQDDTSNDKISKR